MANFTSVYTYAVKDVAPGVPIVSFAMDGGASLVLTAISMQAVTTGRAGVCDTVSKNNVPGLPPVGSYRQETAIGSDATGVNC